MSKRISILHFLSNYIIVLLPIFTLCVMGPTEIYFGNYKELGFTYQEFGWKFLFFSFCSPVFSGICYSNINRVLRR